MYEFSDNNIYLHNLLPEELRGQKYLACLNFITGGIATSNKHYIMLFNRTAGKHYWEQKQALLRSVFFLLSERLQMEIAWTPTHFIPFQTFSFRFLSFSSFYASLTEFRLAKNLYQKSQQNWFFKIVYKFFNERLTESNLPSNFMSLKLLPDQKRNLNALHLVKKYIFISD